MLLMYLQMIPNGLKHVYTYTNFLRENRTTSSITYISKTFIFHYLTCKGKYFWSLCFFHYYFFLNWNKENSVSLLIHSSQHVNGTTPFPILESFFLAQPIIILKSFLYSTVECFFSFLKNYDNNSKKLNYAQQNSII